MTQILLIAGYCAAIALDLLPKASGLRKSEVAAYVFCATLGLAVLLLASFNVYLPSPFQPIQALLKTVFSVGN